MITSRAVPVLLPAYHRRVATSRHDQDDFADPLNALVPQAGFSVASRSISAAILALTGGLPVRCG